MMQSHDAPAAEACRPTIDAVPPRMPPLPRLERLRAALLAAPYELCTQKATLLTEQLRRSAPDRIPEWLTHAHYRRFATSLADQSRGDRAPRWKVRLNNALLELYQRIERNSADATIIAYSHGLRHILERMQLRVYDDELIVGNLSSHRIGAPLHPDYGGLLMAPELGQLASRADNPIAITAAQRRALDQEIFPYWFRRSVLGLTPTLADDPALVDRVVDGTGFVLTQIAGISHVTPDYPAVLRLGFVGIADRIEARRDEVRRQPSSNRRRAQLAFLEAALITTRAAIAYGRRWRATLLIEAARADSARRRRELTELAHVRGARRQVMRAAVRAHPRAAGADLS